MMCLMLLFLVGVPLLLLLGVGTYRLLRKSRDLKVMQGAAFWLSGAIMVFVFVIVGLVWGFTKSSNAVGGGHSCCHKKNAFRGCRLPLSIQEDGERTLLHSNRPVLQDPNSVRYHH